MSSQFEIIQNDDYSLVSICEVQNFHGLAHESFLSKNDLIEFKKISNSAYQKQWLSARWLISESKALVEHKHIDLRKKDSGKLYLKDSPYFISLSHNPRKVSVMLSRAACGIDIEILRTKIIRIQQKFLHREEVQKYSDKVEYLTLIWSAKESVYKMLGISGLIFKEQFNCKIESLEDQGFFELEASISSTQKLKLKVNYRFDGQQILTYTSLADTVH